MGQPEFKDGDDGSDDELEIDFLPDEGPPYNWTKNPDEMRRAFIFEHMAEPNIAGNILVENMEAVFEWLTKGKVPKVKKSHLKVAET